MHPDITGKKDCKEFVKMKEAYAVLSKSDLRELYDRKLKCNIPIKDLNQTQFRQAYNRYSDSKTYTSREEWEAHMAGRWKADGRPNDDLTQTKFLFSICILLAGSVLQVIVLCGSWIPNKRKHATRVCENDLDERR